MRVHINTYFQCSPLMNTYMNIYEILKIILSKFGFHEVIAIVENIIDLENIYEWAYRTLNS